MFLIFLLTYKIIIKLIGVFRWKHSEATVKIYTSEDSKDQTLHSGLNQAMQIIFDSVLSDPNRRTIKSKTTV